MSPRGDPTVGQLNAELDRAQSELVVKSYEMPRARVAKAKAKDMLKKATNNITRLGNRMALLDQRVTELKASLAAREE